MHLDSEFLLQLGFLWAPSLIQLVSIPFSSGILFPLVALGFST